MKVGLLVLALALLVGCGDDGLTANDGVYSIETWTENSDDCNSDGDSILAAETDTAFYIKNESFIGFEFVNLVRCLDVAECATKAADDGTINLSLISFESGSDSAGWRGTGVFLGGAGDGPCNGTVFVNILTFPSDGVARLDIERKEVTDIGRDEDDFCDTDEALAMEPDLPCTSLEVFEGSFVQGI